MSELREWLKEGRTPPSDEEQGKRKIRMTHHLLEAFKDGIIGLREVWLLSGDYKQLKEMPDAEIPLSASTKEDLCIQRLLARPRFRGVVANKPVSILRAFKGVYINTGGYENE